MAEKKKNKSKKKSNSIMDSWDWMATWRCLLWPILTLMIMQHKLHKLVSEKNNFRKNSFRKNQIVSERIE
jgi:hypothetical protein